MLKVGYRVAPFGGFTQPVPGGPGGVGSVGLVTWRAQLLLFEKSDPSMRGRSFSNAMRWYSLLNLPLPPLPPPAKSGLLNTIGVGTLAESAPVPPGQLACWYEGPSKSLSGARHPMNDDSSVAPAGLTTSAGKQLVLSLGFGPVGSESPDVQRNLESMALQYSKWPISSE